MQEKLTPRTVVLQEKLNPSNVVCRKSPHSVIWYRRKSSPNDGSVAGKVQPRAVWLRENLTQSVLALQEKSTPRARLLVLQEEPITMLVLLQ